MERSPRRYWRDRRRFVPWLVIFLLVGWQFVSIWNSGAERRELLAEAQYSVHRVLSDGALELECGSRIGLQGIETPDNMQAAAVSHSEEFLERAGHRVRLSFGRERMDPHDRYLAFVWHDDILLNEELVRAGLAQALLEYRHSGLQMRRLAAAEDEARRAARGLWSDPRRNSTGDRDGRSPRDAPTAVIR